MKLNCFILDIKIIIFFLGIANTFCLKKNRLVNKNISSEKLKWYKNIHIFLILQKENQN